MGRTLFPPLSLHPMVIILFLALVNVQQCNSAKFLFTFFHDTGSHFGSMRPMMEMLVQRGHYVAFLDTIYPKDISPNLHHIRATIPNREDEEWKEMFANMLWHSRLNAHSFVSYYREQDEHLATLLTNYTEKIAEMVNAHWDFIVIDDLFWSFGFAFATLKHRLWEMDGRGRQGNEPHIILYSTAAQSLLSAESVRGVGRNWVSRAPMFPNLPTDLGDVYSPNKFTDRMFGFYETLSEYLLINFVTPLLMPNIEKMDVPNFSWYELYSRTSLEFSDSIDRIGWPMAVGAEMVNVGAHCKRPKRLPAQFADFIDGHPQSNGTIYVAFGTHADWSRAPSRVIDAIMGALKRLPQFRIIFVYNGPIPANLGKHVLLTKWAPQLEILAHPRTRAFITHGGNKSIREGLCAGVPLIVMPIYAEQVHSAHLLLAMGISPVINKFTLTEESVLRTLSGVVLSDDAVNAGKRARKFQSMFLDRPMGAMEEGVFQMERLLRAGRQQWGEEGGATEAGSGRWRQFTQRRGMHLDWAQFAYLDLILFLLLPICTILSVK